MQCQFSIRIKILDNYKFGGWCLDLIAILLRNSRVLVAAARFRSHRFSIDWCNGRSVRRYSIVIVAKGF